MTSLTFTGNPPDHWPTTGAIPCAIGQLLAQYLGNTVVVVIGGNNVVIVIVAVVVVVVMDYHWL